MKTRKHNQRGGSNEPYSNADKGKLLAAGFTPDQIKLLNNIKQDYGLENLNVDGIVFLINENANENLTPTSYTAFYKNKYDDDAHTDNETDDDDDDNNISGGKSKSKTRKRRSRYSTKRETSRRRRKSIKRRNAAHKSRRRRRA